MSLAYIVGKAVRRISSGKDIRRRNLIVGGAVLGPLAYFGYKYGNSFFENGIDTKAILDYLKKNKIEDLCFEEETKMLFDLGYEKNTKRTKQMLNGVRNYLNLMIEGAELRIKSDMQFLEKYKIVDKFIKQNIHKEISEDLNSYSLIYTLIKSKGDCDKLFLLSHILLRAVEEVILPIRVHGHVFGCHLNKEGKVDYLFEPMGKNLLFSLESEIAQDYINTFFFGDKELFCKHIARCISLNTGAHSLVYQGIEEGYRKFKTKDFIKDVECILKGIEILKNTIKNNPYDFANYNNIGQLSFALIRVGNLSKESYQFVSSKIEELKKGTDYFISQVEKFANKAIELNPSYTDAYELRGDIKMKMGRKKEAIEDYEKAISIYVNAFNSFSPKGSLFRSTQIEWRKECAELYRKIGDEQRATIFIREYKDWQ